MYQPYNTVDMASVIQNSSQTLPLYSDFYHEAGAIIRDDILKAFFGLRDSEHARKTHFFGGRYENIYIDREHLPGMPELIEFCISCAAEIIKMPRQSLQCGYWFNEMMPGHVTEPHSHNDDDELLSGVYYLKVPKDSGNLVLHAGEERTLINPEEGKLVLFSSSNVHEVEENKSDETRLSIGMNFGSRRD